MVHFLNLILVVVVVTDILDVISVTDLVLLDVFVLVNNLYILISRIISKILLIIFEWAILTGLDEYLFHPDDAELLTNTIYKISSNMNHFDSTKYPCVICGEIGHAFNACPCLQAKNIEQAYIYLWVLLNWFCCNLDCLNLDSNKQANKQPGDLNAVCHYTISQMDAIEAIYVGILSFSHHHTRNIYFDKIQSLIEDTITLML